MTNSEITLRLVNGDRSVEFHTELPSLIDQIVNGELISEKTLHFANDQWLPLSQASFAPWTDLSVDKAIGFVAQNNPQRCEHFAAKTIRFGGDDLSNPAVRIAYFLLGHLDMVAGNYARATERFHAAASGASLVLAAAHHNLGVCMAYRRQLVGAYHHLNLARAEDPRFFAADLSLRALAMTMLDERAPGLPRSPSWSEILAGTRQRLAKVTTAEVNKACAGRGPFPTFHVIHVFRRARYFPPLSCGLSQEGDNGPAASRLLQVAEEALSQGDSQQALCLATRAGSLSAKLRPTADALSAVANTNIAQDRELARTRHYSAHLARFFSDLNHLTLDRLDDPRESLELITPHSGEEELKHLTAIYAARRMALILDSLAVENDEQQRARLLQMAVHETSRDDKGAYERALPECRARKYLAVFRQAVRHGRLEAARIVLQMAQSWLGDKLGDAENLLDAMHRDQQLERENTAPGDGDLVRQVNNLINAQQDGNIKTRTGSHWDTVSSH